MVPLPVQYIFYHINPSLCGNAEQRHTQLRLSALMVLSEVSKVLMFPFTYNSVWIHFMNNNIDYGLNGAGNDVKHFQ